MIVKQTDPFLDSLLVKWHLAKQVEQEAIRHRRDVEDLIKSVIGFEEGRESRVTLGFQNGRMTITGRLDRKVDTHLVRQLAKENRLEDWLEHLFRWKAEVDVRIWRTAPEYVTQTFAPAITTKPGRATFSLEKQEGDKQ